MEASVSHHRQRHRYRGRGTGTEAEAQVLYHIQSGQCLSRQAPSDGDVVLGLDEYGAEGTTVVSEPSKG